MLITLGLILLILIMVVGGDRGVVSLIALCGNLLILSLAIWLMASGVPVLLPAPFLLSSVYETFLGPLSSQK